MRQLSVILGRVLGLGLLCGSLDAWAEPPGEPLRQMCDVAESVADVDPTATPAAAALREVRSAIRGELRATLRAELQRSLPRGQVPVDPRAQRADSGGAEGRGAAASASEAAAQAQQARRNQTVAAERARGQGHTPLTGTPGPALPSRPNLR